MPASSSLQKALETDLVSTQGPGTGSLRLWVGLLELRLALGFLSKAVLQDAFALWPCMYIWCPAGSPSHSGLGKHFTRSLFEGSFLALRCFKCPCFLDGTAILGCLPWLPLFYHHTLKSLGKRAPFLFSLYPSTPFPLWIIWNTLWVI